MSTGCEKAKNSEEFFCECLANYVIGKLSDDLHDMVERTLAAAAKRA